MNETKFTYRKLADNGLTLVDEPIEYEFRKLSSVDIFPMSKLISKIGLNEFTKAFDADSVKGLVGKRLNKETDKDSIETVAAIQVLMEFVNIIMSHLQECEKEVHSLLSNCTGISIAELKKIYAPDFFEMVVNFVKKDEFMDFYGVVSKLFK